MTMTEFQCTTCRGNNILCDAWVGLNDPEDVRIFDQTFCEDCGGECGVEEVEVTDEDEDEDEDETFIDVNSTGGKW